MSRVVVLGGGPAGVGAALWLARAGHEATLVEREPGLGGNAGSFELAGLRVDYGSHRLHPAADPEILREIRALLGDDLLERPRHGRILLMGRFLHFPLRPLDLLLRVPPRFAVGVGVDGLRRLAPARARAAESFASVLERGLGRTICRDFYFPYARKIWGVEPEALSATQAYKRVSAGSLAKLVRRLLPGGAGSGARSTKGVFYYPRRGYGQVFEAFAQAAEAAGARVRTATRVAGIALAEGPPARVTLDAGAGRETLDADHVFSTIPLAALARLVAPEAPAAVREAASRLSLRAMLLVYLVLETDRFTEYDAHYFPGEDIPFTRLSEPKNYAAQSEPRGRTVLCAEIPCDTTDAIWSRDDAALGDLVREGLARAGLPVRVPISAVAVRRLPAAYPIYRDGYEAHFDALDRWASSLPRVLSFGRQGLYAHDNAHHALAMAKAAVACLRADGSLDETAWAAHRRVFETHVVED